MVRARELGLGRLLFLNQSLEPQQSRDDWRATGAHGRLPSQCTGPITSCSSQWNDVFAAIQAAGLNPAEFERTETSSPRANGFVPVLHHPPSKATFTFDFDGTQPWADYTPGFDRPSDERAAGNWDGQLNYVKQWLEYLKREWHAPDLWAELRAQPRLVTAMSSGASNEPFNPEEQKEIARQLSDIKTTCGTPIS